MIPFKRPLFLILLIGGIGLGGIGLTFILRSKEEPIPELDPLPELVYQRLVERVAEEIELPGKQNTLILPPIEGDADEALGRRLQKELHRRGGIKVLRPKPEEGAPANASWFGENVMPLARKLLEKIVSREKEKPSLLMAGRVVDFTDDKQRTHLAVEWAIRDLDQEGYIVAGNQTEEEIRKSIFSFDYVQRSIASSSRFWRFSLWALALALPALICLSLIKRVLKEESNSLNVGLVAVFALPGMIAAWILTAFGLGFLGTGLTLLAVAVSGLYSFGFLTVVENGRR